VDGRGTERGPREALDDVEQLSGEGRRRRGRGGSGGEEREGETTVREGGKEGEV
jgi:hypothetical protein